LENLLNAHAAEAGSHYEVLTAGIDLYNAGESAYGDVVRFLPEPLAPLSRRHASAGTRTSMRLEVGSRYAQYFAL